MTQTPFMESRQVLDFSVLSVKYCNDFFCLVTSVDICKIFTQQKVLQFLSVVNTISVHSCTYLH
jgi:hypothetical protein